MENPYPSLLSSNNFNPYTVSPYAPLTANEGGDSHNPLVDSLTPYSGTTIEILGNMNIADPYIFSIHNVPILPNQIIDGIVTATVNENAGITNSDFTVTMNAIPIMTVMAQSATFENYYGTPDYTLNVEGRTNTYQLAVGAGVPPIISPYAVYVVGSVKVDGTITITGLIDVSGLYILNNLDISGQLNVYGEYIYNTLDI